MSECPFCGERCETDEELGKHLSEKHANKIKPKPQRIPEHITKELNKLEGLTSWTIITCNDKGIVHLSSSIIKNKTIEEYMAVEGLLVFLAENRAGISGRGPPQVKP